MLEDMFRLDVSALELFLRTTIIYLLLIFTLRFVGRREAGSLELPDLLMVVLIADGVQNGISGEYASVTGALIVGGTIIGWDYALTAAMYRFKIVRTVLRPSPLKVVIDGVLVRSNMRKEFITADEVMAMLREQGVFDLGEVVVARLEADGQLSIKKRDGEDNGQRPPAKKQAGH